MNLLATGVVIALLLAACAWWLVRGVRSQLLRIHPRLAAAEEQVAERVYPPILVPEHMPELPDVIRSQHALRASNGSVGKPTLLYICPVIPSTTGSGLAMRAGMVLRLLSQRYRVWLLSVPVYTTSYPVPVQFADLCQEWAVIPLHEERNTLLTPWVELEVRPGGETPPYENMTFDVVHVFRLYAMPVARFYLSAGATRQLDLDDVESKTHSRHAEVRRIQGDDEIAEFHDDHSEDYSLLEDDVFELVDRIYVCSEHDRDDLADRTDVPAFVLPNAVNIPTIVRRKRQPGPFRFLFIGSLGYFPNQQAVIFFSTEVMPLIRAGTSLDFIFMVAGSGAAWVEDSVAHLPGVDVVGWVPDVAASYDSADVVVAPIPSGGGTRVKVLEAFSYRRPVVATSVGAEGIAARDGEEILIADSAEAFADQCIRLMEDEGFAQRLIDNAFTLLKEQYTLEAIGRALDACPGALPGRAGV